MGKVRHLFIFLFFFCGMNSLNAQLYNMGKNKDPHSFVVPIIHLLQKEIKQEFLNNVYPADVKNFTNFKMYPRRRSMIHDAFWGKLKSVQRQEQDVV
mgnify:CR=1 FL=1